MGIVVVQAVSAQASGATSVTTPSFNSTSSNLLAAIGVSDGKSEPATPYSDNKSNSWQVATPWAATRGSECALSQSYAQALVGGTGHTVTYTVSASGFPSVAVVEISGLDLTAAEDQHASSQILNQSNPHVTGTTPTTTTADEICVSGMTHNGGSSPTFAAANGVVQTSETNTANMPVVLSTQIVTGTGTQNESYTLSPDVSPSHAAGIATYAMASAGPADWTVEGHSRLSPRF